MRRLSFALAIVAILGCGRVTSPEPRVTRAAPPRARDAIAGEYAVTWIPAGGLLEVDARMTGAGATLSVERGAERFVRDVEVSPDRDPPRWAPARRRGALFDAAPCAEGPCRVRYRVALREAARHIDDLDVASEEGEIVEAPPSTWLLAPAEAARDLRLRFRVACPEGARFVTGVFPSKEANGAWDISIDDLWTAPYTAFGPMRVRMVPVKGGTVQLAIGPGKLSVGDDDLVAWTEASARAVASWFGRFPMPTALVLVVVARGPWVGGGRTLAGGGGTVFMRAGAGATLSAYRDDWVLTHEMIHLAFPSVPRESDWAEEGIATYAEPFARVRAGTLSEEEAWRGVVEGLPHGLPAPGDRGLDRTPTWGRIYWGGALFWLLADVEIRKRSENRRGLEHALRGVLEAGGSNAVRWPLADVLAAGDRATGEGVLGELHAAMGTHPHPVDLGALTRSLGVEVSRGRVSFDDHAPLAHIRRAITHGDEQ
ncbi:MAG: hypothetical protein KF819_33200 [Labilithrix sp.]|nr:hypothetical protein [Labilithrix sp.]